MAVSFDTYYINAEDFSDATSIFTDAAMTTVAPDGTYQFNGVHRTMSNGILGSPFFCGTCCANCSGTYIYPIPPAKNVDHTVCSNVGPLINTAMVVKFKFTGTNLGYPLGLGATFDSQFYSGVSSNRFGYLPELYVGNNNVISPVALSGVYQLSGFAWQPLTSTFVTSQSSTKIIGQSDYNVTLGNPDQCYLLVPKTSTSNTIDVSVYSPVVPTDSSGGGCDITIPCPAPLELISVSEAEASRVDACATTREKSAYLMRVNSTSGSPRMFDRVFIDPAGSTPLPDGYYQINALAGTFSEKGWMHVGGGVGQVQSVGACPSGLPFPQPELVEIICSEMRNTQVEACNYQNQLGNNLPDQRYWFDGSGDEPVVNDVAYSDPNGLSPLPDGYYQQLRSYKVFQVSGGSGVISSVIGICT